ncbi:unnamed protein product [Lampetra fluviatilis]
MATRPSGKQRTGRHGAGRVPEVTDRGAAPATARSRHGWQMRPPPEVRLQPDRYGRCERKINRPRVQSHDLNMDHEAAGIISRRAVKSGRFLLDEVERDEALGQRGASIQPSSTSEGGGGYFCTII